MSKEKSNVLIIGSAGRKEDKPLMSRSIFEEIIQTSKEWVENEHKLNWNDICLSSGGAAWCDHVSVSLFLRLKPTFPGLDLHIFLPCKLIKNENNIVSFEKNPCGNTSSYHFLSFSEKMGSDMIQDFEKARNLGATLDDNGLSFKERDEKMAKRADYMLAFTWNRDSKDVPKPRSGTSYTWSQFCGPLSQRKHLSLFFFQATEKNHTSIETIKTIKSIKPINFGALKKSTHFVPFTQIFKKQEPTISKKENETMLKNEF